MPSVNSALSMRGLTRKYVAKKTLTNPTFVPAIILAALLVPSVKGMGLFWLGALSSRLTIMVAATPATAAATVA